MKKGRNVMWSRHASVNRHFDSRFSFLKLARRVPPIEDEKGHPSTRLDSRVSHMSYTYIVFKKQGTEPSLFRSDLCLRLNPFHEK